MNPIKNDDLEIPADFVKTNQFSSTSTPEPEPKATPESPLKQIRTFQGDVAKAIGEGKESIVSIQRAEKAKVEDHEPKKVNSLKSKRDLKKLVLSLGSFVLILGGITGGWYAYNQFSEKSTPPVIYIPNNRLISVEGTVNLELSTKTRSDLIEAIVTEAETPVTAGQTKHINISSSTQDFFTTLDVRAPGRLIRSFDPVFMLGTIESQPQEITQREGSSVFLLVRLSSFENAYAGMLEWEKEIFEDVGPLFSTRNYTRDQSFGIEFKDSLTNNKHSRTLYGPENEILLLYSFFDNNTLIITDSEESLQTLINRLSSELLSR